MAKTLKELGEEYQARKIKVDELVDEFIRCKDRQLEITEEIESLTGDPAEQYIQAAVMDRLEKRVGETGGRRLDDVITEVLKKDKKTALSLRQVAEAILATGYETKSRNFENVVYQAMYHRDDVERVGVGAKSKYRLKRS